MTRALSIAEAARDFEAVVRSVERGEEIVLTRDGRAVVRLSAAGAASEGPERAAVLARTRARLENGLDLDIPRLDRDGLHER